MPNPLIFIWQGDCFEPIKRHAKECDQRYVIGEAYALDEILDRSPKSHRQYFAAVHEGWMNLPDHIAEKYATSEHLRKHALIRCGYFDKRSIGCSSKAEALRVAAFIRPMDEYAVVTVTGSLVEHYTAQSQAYNMMKKDVFQASKTAVLNFIDDLLGLSSGETERQGETA
jgi:hypothetical protein